jgi:hypothetical protein
MTMICIWTQTHLQQATYISPWDEVLTTMKMRSCNAVWTWK